MASMLDLLIAGVDASPEKPVVKISPAPICLLAIRSLRTNWSQMQNIGGSTTLFNSLARSASR
jgi:hypothetical protein